VQPLTVGASSVQGTISPAGDADWWQFTVSSSGTYTIETWAGSLSDNVMTLYGPNSQTTFIEEDDDDGDGNAAKIVRSLSPGTYYVKVRAYSSIVTGTYTIRVVRPSDSEPTLVVNGSSQLGAISYPGANNWWQFTATTAGTYTIDTKAGTLLDNMMTLYGPDSQTTFIEEDDDDGDGNAARIVRSLAPGTYYVKIRAYWGNATGTYTISVRR